MRSRRDSLPPSKNVFGVGRTKAEPSMVHETLDNTLVVFTSDNGGERFSDNWPLVGGKWT